MTTRRRGVTIADVDDRTGSLPLGTVTFLFTDIEDSTLQAEALGSAWPAVLAVHHDILRRETSQTGGVVVSTEGDAFFVAFDRAAAAIGGAIGAQRALAAEDWPTGARIRVRMGLHTGDAVLGGDNYAGIDVNRAARIAGAAHGGQILVSAATRELTEAEVAPAIGFRDLGEHRLKGLARPERLQQVLADGLDERFPPPRTQTATLDLPVHLTSFVGRDEELAQARSLLDDGARLVTLTGPGGTGKTRLSVRLAADVADRFADGVQFVDLSMVGDATMVPAAVARSLRLVERPDRAPLDSIAEYLRERTTLLVLDNFEQVAAAAPLVPQLLRSAPGLTVLATSRGPLRVSGERELGIPPLPLPRMDGSGAAQAATSPAVTLFVERATAARSDFRLTDDNAPAVVAICARLDGLPLAIELAAARVRLLSPEAILSRLGQSLDILNHGGRDLPARQQTLRGAIDWSHDLLDDATRRLFARLSVFAGGARFDAIEAVCGPAVDLGTDVLRGLEDLVDQSLVQWADLDGEPRYSMLQTIHEFASERLAASGEREVIRRRHAETLVALVERAAPELLASDQRIWLDLLEREHDNLAAAIDWTVANEETDLALRLVSAPWRFFQMRDHLVEGRDLIAAALVMPNLDAHPIAHARALSAEGGIAYWLGDYPTSQRSYDEALTIARTVGDPRLLAEALSDVSLSSADVAEPATLAAAAEKGFSQLEEALAIYRELGDRRGEAGVLWTIGTGFSYTGDLAASERYLTEAAGVAEESGDLFHASWATYMLAGLRTRNGDTDGAAAHIRRALEMFASVRDSTGMMLCLSEVGYALTGAGDVAAGLRLEAAAAAFESRHGGTYLANIRGLSMRPDPRTFIGDDPALAAAWAEGETLSLEEAVALALADIDAERWRIAR